MKRSFRERDPLRMGVLGMTSVALLVFLAFDVSPLEGGTTYTAAFAEASGLKPGEYVRIAGVKVGRVASVGLESDHVKVTFTVRNGVRFGALSRLRIKLSTILGAHYLEVRPGGARRQPPRAEIPTSRTTPSYEVVPALQDLSGRLQQIDVKRLSTAFDTLSATMRGSPAELGGALAGLRKISRAVASREDSLGDLLRHSSDVTRLLADRSGDLATLVSDGSLVLRELHDRRAVVRSLLSGTVNLSTRITATIEENRATLGPALTRLHRVLGILVRDQDDLDRAIRTLGPFVTTATDGSSSGRWFDGYLQNLVPLPASVAPPSGGGTLPRLH